MKSFKTSQIVLMGDLNHHGTLFVGKAITWLSEAGFMTATQAHKDPMELVYYAMNGFKFLHPVKGGEIVNYCGKIVALGKTSITVAVSASTLSNPDIFAEGFITYVVIDKETRKKKPHNLTLDEPKTEEERLLREKAKRYLAAIH